MISKQERLSAEHRQPFCTVVVSIMWICLLSLGSWFLNPAMILRAGVNTEDFLIEGTTLVAYQGTAASVSIPDSVTVIGAEAFKGNQKITAVTIPEGVVRLEASAFDGCNRLTQVSIGSGLQTLGDGVFSGCDSLKEVTISPDNTKFTCEDGTLYQKEKADVNRHQTEDSLIICQVFAGREKENYRMSDRVTGIRKYAFWGCSKLNQITLSNALTEIPAYAFSNCTGLKQITIPYSVRNIQMKAFEHCKNLVLIDLPKSVREIHKTAFDGCNQLETEIPQVANEKQKPEETVSANHILGEAVIVGNHAVVLMDSAGEEVLTGNEVYQLRADRPDITADLSEDRTQVKRRVHYRDTDTRTYRIPTGVTAIGEFAFARSALTSITIPDGVTEIGYAAFYHCDELSEVTIPPSVTKIGKQAFDKTPWMNNWMISDTPTPYLIVGDGILIAYKGQDAILQLPKEIKQADSSVFKDHKELTQVTLADGTRVL